MLKRVGVCYSAELSTVGNAVTRSATLLVHPNLLPPVVVTTNDTAHKLALSMCT